VFLFNFLCHFPYIFIFNICTLFLLRVSFKCNEFSSPNPFYFSIYSLIFLFLLNLQLYLILRIYSPYQTISSLQNSINFSLFTHNWRFCLFPSLTLTLFIFYSLILPSDNIILILLLHLSYIKIFNNSNTSVIIVETIKQSSILQITNSFCFPFFLVLTNFFCLRFLFRRSVLAFSPLFLNRSLFFFDLSWFGKVIFMQFSDLRIYSSWVKFRNSSRWRSVSISKSSCFRSSYLFSLIIIKLSKNNELLILGSIMIKKHFPTLWRIFIVSLSTVVWKLQYSHA
jgi:hypothetical protein